MDAIADYTELRPYGHGDEGTFYLATPPARVGTPEPVVLKVLEAGIAHRAISPATVVLHDEGAELADLELARFINPGMTVTSVAPVASIEHTDPAIVRGERAGRSSDIWSRGVTLHRAVSGRSAYGDELPAGDLLSAVRRVLSTRPVVADGVEPEVATIVAACLSVDPDDRPQTASDLAELLEELL